MVTSIHAMIYSDDPAATRAFLRDVFGWPYVEHADSEPGWLIFKSGPSEMGVHPTSGEHGGQSYSAPRHHSVSFMCDEIEATVAELRSRGAIFEGEPQNMGFGIGVMMKVPGADDVLLYQPLHPTAYNRV
jgi:catechol 2,3-dioxygenase-like lactoylglutathione lyase family enzyme